MAVTRKLDLEEDEIKCFSFSCAYVAGILSAFRRWSGPTYRKFIPDPPPTAQPKIEYDWRGIIEMDYQKFLERPRRSMHKTFPVEFYEQLVMDGFIYPTLYRDEINKARIELCNELQTQITVHSMALDEQEYELSEIAKYQQTKDFEKKLIEYRNGSRDAEVILRAKQVCVLMLFYQARNVKMKNLYVRTDE